MESVFSLGDILFYLSLGLCAGILSAVFGIGSGIVVVPSLTMFALMTQKEAQGVALAVMVPMAIMGAMRYYWNPSITINLKVVLLMGMTCVIGANIGASIAGYVSNRTLQLGFSILLFVVAIKMFLSALKAFGI